MNTPPQRKRHSFQFKAPEHGRSGTFAYTINDPEIGLALAKVVAEFNSVESFMSQVLAALMGAEDDEAAGYILRSVIAPRARFDILKNLLEKAPRNRERDATYDELLAEYKAISGKRNAYVHGHWFSCLEDGSTWISEQDEHGFAFLESRPIGVEELIDLHERIGALLSSIVRVPMAEIARKKAPRRP